MRPVPYLAENVQVARPVSIGDEWKLDGCGLDLAGRRIGRRLERRLAVAERHDRDRDRDRPFVHQVGADDSRHRCVPIRALGVNFCCLNGAATDCGCDAVRRLPHGDARTPRSSSLG